MDDDDQIIGKLTKDLREAARIMTPDEARYMVDSLYQIQENRLRADGQIRSQTGEPHAVLDWVSKSNLSLENQIKLALKAYASAQVLGEWSMKVKGIGPVIAAGLLAHLRYNPPPPTVGHYWRYAGLDPSSKWVSTEDAKKWIKENSPELNDDSVRVAASHFGRKFDSLNKFATTNRDGDQVKLTMETLSKAISRRPHNASLKTLCVRPGCYVTTRRGPVKIEDVVVGDKVLTHLGRWRAVTDCYVNQFDGSLIGIRSAGAGNSVAWLTPGHPVYAASVKTWTSGRTFKPNEATRQEFDWHAAEAVAPRWQLSRPRIPIGLESAVLRLNGVETKDGFVAAQGRWAGVAAPRARPVPAMMDVDEDLARLIGLYVAEGHVSGNYIGWSFNESETNLIQFVSAMLSDRFGVKPFYNHNPDKHSMQIMCGSKPIAQAISSLCGYGSLDVHLPWLDASEPIRRGLWTGVMEGDGDHCGKLAARRITTVSPVLAWELVELGRQLGKSVSLHKEPVSNAYRIHVNERQDEAPSARVSLSLPYVGPVYNLEVEEDHSYVVQGYAVHNCWKVGESFVKVSGNPASVYGKHYADSKSRYNTLNIEGRYKEAAAIGMARVGKSTQAYGYYSKGILPPGHIHARAKRAAVKLFLSHWHEAAWRSHFKTDPPKPFSIGIQGHGHYIGPEVEFPI